MLYVNIGHLDRMTSLPSHVTGISTILLILFHRLLRVHFSNVEFRRLLDYVSLENIGFSSWQNSMHDAETFTRIISTITTSQFDLPASTERELSR
jgi:hypothetical protein